MVPPVQGSPASPALEPEPASSIGVGRVLRERYVLQSRLGTDGGSVFKALDRFRSGLPETHQYVALKILHAGGPCSEDTLADLRLEFYCAQLLSHRNIINVYELDRDADVIFFTMELLEGEPLSEVMEHLRPAPMRRAQAWQLIEQIGAGLAHAHEREVIHGSLDPRHIFVTREGELRIFRFGAAQRHAAMKSSVPAALAPSCASPAYASCEQLEGRAADRRDDLYALACLCYELLAGCHPFGSRPATLARDYRVSAVRPQGLTSRQWSALQKGLSWHRAARSISVHSWTRKLTKGRVQAHSVTPLQELTQPLAPQSRAPWHPAVVFAVLALAAVGLVHLRSTFAVKAVDASPALPMAATEVVTSAPRIEPPDALNAAEPGGSARKAVAHGEPQAKATPKPKPVAIAVEPFQVRSDDHFAEIRLQRNLPQKNGSFTWWTEPATAKPGIDYVPEAVAIQTFPPGYRATRLYVRLLPQPLRSQRSYFYIAIAQTGAHTAGANVIRRQIWLPATSNLQARR
jgi:serine/threonine protein kinase